MSSSALQLKPSGSLNPVCVWASNSSVHGSSSMTAACHGTRRSSAYTVRNLRTGPRGERKGHSMATNGDRLTGLDASVLHLESNSAHMHVAGVMLFDGSPPGADELIAEIESRLHLVPRYRQRLAFVPFGQGRPRWVDDPHLNLRYHVRSTALPSPGSQAQPKALAGRVLSQRPDRDNPPSAPWAAPGPQGGERLP